MSTTRRGVDGTRRRFPAIWAGVAVHAVLVGFFALTLLLTEAQDTGVDANIGAGLATMPVMALGFPWWLPFDSALSGGYVADSGIIAASLLNLGIHAWIIRRLARL